MRFPDDKEKENINWAECERKQGNDEGSSLQLGSDFQNLGPVQANVFTAKAILTRGI